MHLVILGAICNIPPEEKPNSLWNFEDNFLVTLGISVVLFHQQCDLFVVI